MRGATRDEHDVAEHHRSEHDSDKHGRTFESQTPVGRARSASERREGQLARNDQRSGNIDRARVDVSAAETQVDSVRRAHQHNAPRDRSRDSEGDANDHGEAARNSESGNERDDAVTGDGCVRGHRPEENERRQS